MEVLRLRQNAMSRRNCPRLVQLHCCCRGVKFCTFFKLKSGRLDSQLGRRIAVTCSSTLRSLKLSKVHFTPLLLLLKIFFLSSGTFLGECLPVSRIIYNGIGTFKKTWREMKKGGTQAESIKFWLVFIGWNISDSLWLICIAYDWISSFVPWSHSGTCKPRSCVYGENQARSRPIWINLAVAWDRWTGHLGCALQFFFNSFQILGPKKPI